MIYVAEADIDIENTWSGTTYSLLKALEKQTDVTQIFHSRKVDRYERFPYILKNFFTTGKIEKDVNFNSYYQIKREELYMSDINSLNEKPLKILQIGDIVKSKSSAIYTDLSISYLLHCMYNDYEAFKYSGFAHIRESELIRRNTIQKERYNAARYIFTMSKNLEEFLKKEGYPDNKIIHVGGGINLESKINQNTKMKNRKRILFVGRDFQRKGGDIVVQAFKKMYMNDSELELYIAGPNKLSSDFSGNGIIFLGNLKKEELIKYFEICDIFCMPSRFEAYGLVFIEALSYGLPCVGVNKFEMKNFIENGENGYLNATYEVDELVKNIEKLLKNDDIFRRVNENMKLYKKLYSWDNVAERIKLLLN